MRSSANSGARIAAYSAAFSGAKGTYHARKGSTASDSPTMRSLNTSNPVVSVSKQNSS